ncbi:MAG TPA: toprim domain-containing protein [Verrucomicrobiales bacterium]|nr:toprim domain-containing protein [Verrucomicrobiales bacterium]
MNDNILERARRYLAKMPLAISGSGGDAATCRAAHALVKGFNISPDKALPLMLEWNTACLPPWSEAELRGKLASAAKSAAPFGYLLRDQGRATTPAAQKAANRLRWPDWRKPSREDLAAIAARRGISTEAAALAASLRHLWRCVWRDAECFAIHAGSFAQVRRLDGQPFIQRDGGKVKALNLPGSEGAFLNPGGMGEALPVILTEGAVSLLESLEAIRRANAALEAPFVAVLAAVSAQSRFTPGHLRRIAGRRVRIVADNDPAGIAAAANWTATLKTVGCRVDCLRMPPGLKDLGDALRAIPEKDSFWQKLLTF